MKKRVFSFLLAVCTALSLTMTSCAAQEGPEADANPSPVSAVSQELPFTDIPADAWYTDEMQYCYEHGMFAGTSDTTFSPDDTLTRAMLVTILYRAAGSPSLDNENLGYPFSDVPGDIWYADGVYWARMEGVVGGYGNNAFGPNDPVTREQAVSILWRYTGSPTASSGTFSDSADLADWAVSAAGWAQAAGLLTGWADSSFQHQTPLTRAEAAVLLARYLEGSETAADGSSSILVAYFSATGTTRPLAEYAAAEGFAQIELVGVCTDICVISNALLLKAYLPEAEISVRADCCAGVTPESHARALDAMAACQVEILR